LNGTTRLKAPSECSDQERREFERLVRQGFDGSDEGLDGRIRDAECLAFYYGSEDTLTGIAGLKAPDKAHRARVFTKARLDADPSGFPRELGWVFVEPAHREQGIANRLCRELLSCAGSSGVFATTREDNELMMGILVVLGFQRAGSPYPRRNGEFVMFLRGHHMKEPS